MLCRQLAKALAVLVVGVPVADAAWYDQISPFVVELVTRDDNVFRLADGVDPQAAIGAPSATDVYHATSAGLAFDVAAGAQRFEGQLALSRYRFARFDTLDFNGNDARAVWRWRAGDRFTGNVGHDRTEALASLANVQSGTRSTAPNVLETQHSYVTATYEPTPRWSFRADVRATFQRNGAIEYRPSDLDAHSTELALAYVTEGMTRLGLIATNLDGRLPNPQRLGGIAVDNSYEQRGLALFIEWQASPHSQIKARTGSTRRSYVDIPQRDFRGSTYVATFDWRPTDYVTLTAISQRDISSSEEVNVGLVLSEGLSFHTLWSVRPNAALSLELERADRTYLGDAASFLGGTQPYAERVRSTGTKLSLHPRTRLTLDLAWRHERRASLTRLGSYGAAIASVGFRFAF
jgi:Putative beta-barrel porin 2